MRIADSLLFADRAGARPADRYNYVSAPERSQVIALWSGSHDNDVASWPGIDYCSIYRQDSNPLVRREDIMSYFSRQFDKIRSLDRSDVLYSVKVRGHSGAAGETLWLNIDRYTFEKIQEAMLEAEAADKG
jgi:hypothetical protein